MTTLPEEILPFVRESIGEEWEVHSLLGDASTRGYFRISTPAGKRYMLAYYPETTRKDVERFLGAHKAIANHARVPLILFHSESGVIQEDVGDENLFEIVKKDRRRGIALYRSAIDLLVAFQKSPVAAHALNPRFDVPKFSEELEMTRKYFVEELTGEHSSKANRRLHDIFERLASQLTGHPYVLCHRDYHGQNIHILNDTLYMIDYQDMRLGPDTYDLASLLRDRGIARVLGRDTEETFIEYYASKIDAGAELRPRYLETLLQRSIKVLGTFASQAVERGRIHYLDYIPPALESVRFCLAELRQYADLQQVFPLDFDLNAVRSRLQSAARA